MDKNETLKSILAAKKAHIDRMNKVKSRLDGVSEDELVLVSKQECGFGIWFYSDERLKRMLGTQFYENLETLHTKWHIEYQKLYELCYENRNKKGLFSKLVGNNKVSKMVIDKAKLYYSDLEITTGELIKAIDSSYRRLNALNESYFS
jgi:hypothetical protein